MEAKLIKSNGNIISVKPGDGNMFKLNELQSLVGGYIEVPFQLKNGYYIVCDEEGRLKGKPANPVATEMAICGGANLNYYLVGDILMCPENMIE